MEEKQSASKISELKGLIIACIDKPLCRTTRNILADWLEEDGKENVSFKLRRDGFWVIDAAYTAVRRSNARPVGYEILYRVRELGRVREDVYLTRFDLDNKIPCCGMVRHHYPIYAYPHRGGVWRCKSCEKKLQGVEKGRRAG